MARGRAVYEHAPSLPPVELRLPEFRHPGSPSFHRLETPVTGIGLVDTPRLLKLVKGTLSAAYKWPSILDDEHHLLWPNRLYDTEELQKFRNRPINRKDWPRTFHNWAHRVTLPTAIPPEETRHSISIFQDSVNDMHGCVQVGKMLTRSSDISQRSLRERLKELHEDYHGALARIEQLPAEYQLIEPEAFHAETIYDMLTINGELGRLATVSTVGTATRYIRQPTHAPVRQVVHAA